MKPRLQDVGIKALEIYFPNQYVAQTDLEKFQGVEEGKFTIGLGQTKMSFVDDREDTYSMALTALSSLLRKYSIDPRSIGRLEVGTESLLDKSKSCKSVLMQLFEPAGNTDIEGVDTYNACYGGTSALFNAINWIESSAWDGRDAVVVAGDIAIYQQASALPTGGAGCIAMLIGPGAPLVFDRGMRGIFMKHVYDFYKANLLSEYPIVDGRLSIQCYLESIDACYRKYHERKSTSNERGHLASNHAKPFDCGVANGTYSDKSHERALSLDSFDYFVFHAPTCKLVAKSYARMLYNDYLQDPENSAFLSVPSELQNLDQTSTSDNSWEKTFMALAKERFLERVKPGTMVATMCGNMYCASVFGSLISLLCNTSAEQLFGKRVGMFSYGSGLASSLYSLQVKGDVSKIVEKIDLHNRLNARLRLSPQIYKEACKLRELAYNRKGYVPWGRLDTIAPGTYYLVEVDETFQRRYAIMTGSQNRNSR